MVSREWVGALGAVRRRRIVGCLLAIVVHTIDILAWHRDLLAVVQWLHQLLLLLSQWVLSRLLLTAADVGHGDVFGLDPVVFADCGRPRWAW